MRILKISVIMALLFVIGPSWAMEETGQLSAATDPQLQQALVDIVQQQGLEDAVKNEQIALALLIVTDPEKPRLAELNGHRMVYAASLPKIAILLGAAVAIEEGRLELDKNLHEDLNNMIRHSCNPCATRVLEMVGRQELLEILQSPEYRFYERDGAGGLWVGKDYGPDPAYARDPITGLSHGATVFQAARFYYKLHTGTLVSPQQSSMMLEALSNPGIRHKFVKGLRNYEGLEIYRKSGTWKTYHSDSALVRYDGQAYIMVALANSPQGSKWLELLAAPLHELALAEGLKNNSP